MIGYTRTVHNCHKTWLYITKAVNIPTQHCDNLKYAWLQHRSLGIVAQNWSVLIFMVYFTHS